MNRSKTELNKSYLTVSVLGRNLRLEIKYKNISTIDVNRKENEIELNLPHSYKNVEKLEIINLVVKELYNSIAYEEIEDSMEVVRHILRFAPEDYKIERMKDSFCKTKSKVITVNPDIVQYSKTVIDTTLIQAFCKSAYKVKSNAYKEAVKAGLNRYEMYKNNIQNLSVMVG